METSIFTILLVNLASIMANAVTLGRLRAFGIEHPQESALKRGVVVSLGIASWAGYLLATAR